MAKGVVDMVKSLGGLVKGLTSDVEKLATSIEKVERHAGNAASNTKNVLGTNGKVGSGTKVALGTDNAQFGNTSSNDGGNRLYGSLATSKVQQVNSEKSAMPSQSSNGGGASFSGESTTTYSGGGGGGGLMGWLQIAASIGKAGYNMAPNLGDILQNSGGYYNAAVFGGGTRQALESQTLRAMNGGLTNPMGGMQTATTLINGYSYAAGSSAYRQTAAEVGGAAKYLNMSNSSAAAALGGLQTGQTGGNLYQYGIHTIDPKTGKQLSTEAIARQAYDRIFTNQKGLTTEDVRSSLQYGMAGANLQNMGLSADQQSIFKQAFINFSQGKGFDLANAKGSSAAGGNPLDAAYQINSSQANLMQAYEQPMIDGFKAAAVAITTVNKGLEAFAGELGRIKGFMQGIGGSNLAGGAGVFNGISNGIQTIGAARYLKSLGASTSTEGAAAAETAAAGTAGADAAGAAGAASASMGALSVAGTVGLSAGAGYVVGKGGKMIGHALGLDKSATGRAVTRGGSMAAAAGAGALIGTAFMPGVGTAIGAGIGLVAGWFGSGGSKSVAMGASFGASGGATGTQGTQSPVPGAAATTPYGATDQGVWPGAGNYHTGQDYPVPVGTPVVAAADGIVFDDAPGFDYGIYVQIDHGNGYQTLYGHLSTKSVKVGDKVTKGQVIGKSGETGNVTGPHLHFEVRKGKNNPIDPKEFLGNNMLNVEASVIGDAASMTTTGSSTGSSGGANKPANYTSYTGGDMDQKGWAAQFLKDVNAPITDSNLTAVTRWMAQEGGNWNNTAKYNPLNTTQTEPGSSPMNNLGNGIGVQAYTSWDQGLQATVATIENGRYGGILAALQSGDNPQAVYDAIVSSPWGTKSLPGHGGGSGNYGGFGASVPDVKGGGSSGYGAAISTSSSGNVNNNVYVTLTIDKASQEDAIAFAKTVKSYLEKGNQISTLGS